MRRRTDSAAVERGIFESDNIRQRQQVGTVILHGNQIIATGHTLADGQHAAMVAIGGARRTELLRGATMYTTMEPSCTERIVEAGVACVVIGVKEPTTFENCNGVEELRVAGVDVVHLKFLEEECLRTNIHLLAGE
ncbi:hypothetical protein DL89DRAFT_265611 [Linderina pennispora]|uniref:CMP/dCMP-type deaminase domain-containing protein n=1 Tax=Linderina pennispora TaxID=61395 RepID=A0A1Y1WEG1_9FUNG|nr:uncharacterized protein DL89DRAFT_265611 [Linderina pennispora]ORX71907.1 hypothetical protein DL89DRAFT_265611 [Linderina pennispora]